MKITPEISKAIKILAKHLPTMQRLENGKPMARILKMEKILGKDMKPEDKAQFKDFDENATYTRQVKEPVLLNHEVNLTTAYRKAGNKGTEEYLKSLAQIDPDLQSKVLKAEEEYKQMLTNTITK